jgi:membrane-bound serine protease (ClpP class)
VGGAVAFVAGSVMLIDTDLPGYDVPWTLIGGVTAASLAFTLLVIGMAVKARHRPVVSGGEGLLGAAGEVLEHREGRWWARVQGEMWEVRSSDGLRRHQRVRVRGRDGLTLLVEPEQPEQGA